MNDTNIQALTTDFGKKRAATALDGDSGQCCAVSDGLGAPMRKRLSDVFIAILSAAASSLVEWLLNQKRNDHDEQDRDRSNRMRFMHNPLHR